MEIIDPAVAQDAPNLAQTFAQAQPFRHVVVENFLDDALARQLLADFPSFEEKHARNELGLVGGKAVRMDMPQISPAYAALDRHLQSPEFLRLIETISGIPDLLYDPAYVGGGTHENVNGQALDAHVDFNYLPGSGWHRRLNLIIYLNPDWDADWGGCLDLHSDPWNSDADQITQVLPLFNRCVIFETNEISWHGFNAITLPQDRQGLTRKSVAIYLYTRERPAHETAPNHGTIYVPPGLPQDLQPGVTLSESQWLKLRKAHTQMRSQLKFMYQRELVASANYAEVKQALEQARLSLSVPLQGFLLQSGGADGYFPDGWVGQRFKLTFTPTRSARLLILDVYVPAQLQVSQRLTVDIDGQRQSFEIAPGTLKRIELRRNWSPGVASSLSILAERTFVPALLSDSPDNRELCFKWVEASLE